MIRSRVARLPGAAQRLVEVIAVAGRPVAQRVAQNAAGLDVARRLDLVQLLRSAQLIRSTGGRDTDVIECYHDRIRETVVGTLTEDELRAHHRELAVAIQAIDETDAEALATHFRAAGDDEAAAKYVVEAARQAAEALAFDRAAELYELALVLGAATEMDRGQLLQHLGEALVNAGRGGEAGRCFLEASADAEGAASLELRGRAAEQFLRAGYIDEGMTALRSTLAEVGIALPRSPMRAVPSLLWARLRLRLRGLSYVERDESELSRSKLLRVDLLHGATVGLALVDPVTAGAFGAKQVLLSLRLGEPMRIARAVAIHAGFLSAGGIGAQHRVARVLDVARAAAERSGDPRAIALTEAMSAFAASQQGRMRETLRLSDLAEARLRAECTGVAWEVHSMQLCSLSALLYLGEFGELARRTPPLVEQAHRDGDLFATTNLRALLLPAAYLAWDEPQRARQVLEEASAVLSQRGFYFHHTCALLMNAQTDLYLGDGRLAWKRCLEGERPLEKSMLLFSQLVRGNWRAIKALSALAAAVAGEPNPARLRRVALREARRLGREGTTWCSAHATLLRAIVAAQRGQVDQAVRLLDRAAEQFDRAEWCLKGVICRRRKGELIGGDEGRALLEEASRWAAAHGVNNLDAVSECFAPGFSAPKQLGSGSNSPE